MSGNDIQNLLKSGVEAARAGNKTVAKAIFEQVIQLDSQNEMAWMWMASVSETAVERQRALQRVLNINPDNERAKQALAKLGGTPSPRPEPPLEAVVTPSPELSSLREPPPPAAPDELPRPEPEPSPRQEGNSVYMILVALLVIVLVLIGVIVVLISTGFFEEDSPTTPIAQAPTVIATLVPPTLTPQPAVITLIPGSGIGVQELPPTWTPSPTASALPTDTPTPEPSDPSDFEIIFALQENPAALMRLQRMSGDGSNATPLEIRLGADDLRFGDPTATPPGVTFVNPDEALATAELATEEVVVETRPAFDQFEFRDPAWSPDGNTLAFTAQISPTVQEIFLLNLQTNRVQQLTEMGASITDGAAWSPDGRTITFSSNLRSEDSDSERIFDLYSITVETRVLVNLTNGAGQNREPVWTPDGQTLIFSSDRTTPGELEIWALPFNSAEPIQLTNNSGSSFSPAVSHDGLRIAFISNRAGDNDVYVMASDGTSEQVLSISDDGADDRDPAWSPDDNWLVVSSTRAENRVLQLWLLSPDGNNWQQLTDGLGGSRYAVWQPPVIEE